MQTGESKNENVSESTGVPADAVTDANGGIIDKQPDPVAAEAEEPDRIEIDSFTVFEVAGIKYIIGLGLDSQVYNWDIIRGVWKPFLLKQDRSASPADPMDTIL